MRKLAVLLLMTLFIGVGFQSCLEVESKSKATQTASQAMATDQNLLDSDVRGVIAIKYNSYGKEQLFTEGSQANFNKIQPPTRLDWSLERDNIDKRNQRWNDPNKVSYIYLMSDYGTIIAYFPIKGKVSSVNSKLTTNMQVVSKYYNSGGGVTGTVESPSMDGSYGTNGDGIFFFLTDGTYMEWAGVYLLCDNYIKLTQKPVLTYNIKE